MYAKCAIHCGKTRTNEQCVRRQTLVFTGAQMFCLSLDLNPVTTEHVSSLSALIKRTNQIWIHLNREKTEDSNTGWRTHPVSPVLCFSLRQGCGRQQQGFQALQPNANSGGCNIQLNKK